MRCSAPMVRMPSRRAAPAWSCRRPRSAPTGCRARNVDRLGLADHREAARLLEVGGDLGEELVEGEADRDGDADLASRSAPAAWRALSAGGAPCSRSVPERSRKASSIESGSTSGVSSCISARTSRPTRHVFLHVRRDDDGVRAGFQRLEHRHGRAHAADAGDVAGGRHHAALAAADDDRLVGERRDRRASRSRRRRRRNRGGRWSSRKSSGWRIRRGLPQAEQRPPAAGVRQSRQKPGIEAAAAGGMTMSTGLG